MAHCLSVKTRLLKITSLFLIWNQTKDDLGIPKCRRRPMRWQHISCCKRVQWGFGTLAMGSQLPFAAVDPNVCYAGQTCRLFTYNKNRFARFAIAAKHTRLNIRLSRLCL
jgi:hypothetical protein